MKIGSKLYMALVFALLYAPIVVLIVFSFNSSNSMAVFEGFSLKWYKELFSNEAAITALMNSLILALSSALISTFFLCCYGRHYYGVHYYLRSGCTTVHSVPVPAGIGSAGSPAGTGEKGKSANGVHPRITVLIQKGGPAKLAGPLFV